MSDKPVYLPLEDQGGPTRTVQALLRELLERGLVQAVMVPAHQGTSGVVMQTLITRPGALDRAEPFAPVAWSSAAPLAATLSSRPAGVPVAAVLRSCEARAFMELVKLHQGDPRDLLLIGLDCLGRYENRDYLALAGEMERPGDAFLRTLLEGQGSARLGEAFRPGSPEDPSGREIAGACQICEHPVTPGADLLICTLGTVPEQPPWLEVRSPRGLRAVGGLRGISLPPGEGPQSVEALSPEAPPERARVVEELVRERTAARDRLFALARERSADPQALRERLAGCLGCHNCRVACPVCYCRECVFLTDTFRHETEQLLSWASKHGALALPGDILFFHLTRMIHMSTLCVGCGQCESACPMGLPVMELFRTVAQDTQGLFDYTPGLDPEQVQPMATFHSKELEHVTPQRD